jgi:hypothetical protein
MYFVESRLRAIIDRTVVLSILTEYCIVYQRRGREGEKNA